MTLRPRLLIGSLALLLLTACSSAGRSPAGKVGEKPTERTSETTPYFDPRYGGNDSGRPTWSPDGSRIAFISDRDVVGGSPGGGWRVQWDVFSIGVDGKDATNLTKTANRGEYDPAWSPDGSKIAFVADDNGFDVFVMDPTGGPGVSLTNAYPGVDRDPTWSPDGRRIAFSSDRAGHRAGPTGCTIPEGSCPADIFVMNPDGSDVKNVTRSGRVDERSPAWSPDGGRIAFVVDFDLYVMNADGGNRKALTQGPAREHDPAWSPDGTKIAFAASTTEDNYDIFVMSAEGKSTQNLTKYPSVKDLRPAWSPDGTRIAFASSREGNVNIFTMNVDGSDVRNIMANGP